MQQSLSGMTNIETSARIVFFVVPNFTNGIAVEYIAMAESLPVVCWRGIKPWLSMGLTEEPRLLIVVRMEA
jgi:hypothetical protein